MAGTELPGRAESNGWRELDKKTRGWKGSHQIPLTLSLALGSFCKMLTMFLRQKETRNGKSKRIGRGYGLFSFPDRGVLYNGILLEYQFYS